MATTQTNPTPKVETLKIQRTVFDLSSFDDVKLVKEVPAPVKVASVEEALAAVGNDTAKLLAVINDGLVSDLREREYNSIAGFLVVDSESGDATETEYSGTFADEKKGKAINLMLLSMAKAFSGGMWDSSTREQKKAWKDAALTAVKATPAILASVQG